ncbi:MAG: hypothetical protein ACPLYE_01010, partial [Candidatus Micrarchaeales archaeon]
YCPNQYSINAIAPWYCSQIDQAAYKTFAEWEPILLLAVLFSFMIAALIFIIGVAARNKKIVNYGIGEFYEAGASLIFVVFFMLIVALIFGILPGLYIGVDPYNTSLTYIYNTINATQELLKALYNPAMVAYFYTSININVETLATATTIINYLAPALEVLFIVPATALSTLLVEGLMVLYAEFYLIMFAMYASIPILLIPGVFLRSILPTRGVGGLLIGAAIGFYFILPTLFSIAFFFTSKGTMQAFVAATAQLNSIAQGSDAITNGAVPNGPNSIPQEINAIKSAMGSFWISVIFYPALILALTYFSITTIADLLGGMAMSTGALARV